MKKLKLWALISLFVLLTSCDESCSLHFYYLLDSGRLVFLPTPIGVLALGPSGAIFALPDFSGISFDYLTAPVKYTGARFPVVPNSLQAAVANVATSSKPPMWAVSSDQNAVYELDPNTINLLGSVQVGRAPTRAVFSVDNKTLYVTNSGSNSISAIDTNSLAATTFLSSGLNRPTGIVTTPDGASLFVINAGSNSVSQVDTTKKSVVATFPVGPSPTCLAVTPDGLLLYVTNGGDNTITVYDVLTLEKVQTVTGIADPTWIAFSIDGITAYITSGSGGMLYTLRTKSYHVGKTPVVVGKNPTFVALDTYNTLIYVTNQGSSTLTIINGGDLSIAGTLPVGATPNGVVSLP
jgi:YVTN family beta-propeller protein